MLHGDGFERIFRENLRHFGTERSVPFRRRAAGRAEKKPTPLDELAEILRNRGEATPSGINHFGFEVEDLKDVEKKLAKWDEPMSERPSTRPFAEYRAMDPDGNLFDISVHGYGDVEYAAVRERKKVTEKAPA